MNTIIRPKKETTGSSEVGLNSRHIKNVHSMMIPYTVTNRRTHSVMFFIIAHTPSIRFRSATYFRDMMTFSPLDSTASNRPDREGRT